MEELLLERMDDIAVCRPAAPAGFPQAVQFVSAVIAKAREEGFDKLLLVGHGLEFDPPSIAERHQMAREWAEAAEGRIAVALVVPSAYIDPEKFGVLAARNFGLLSNVFETEAEAIAWLRDPH